MKIIKSILNLFKSPKNESIASDDSQVDWKDSTQQSNYSIDALKQLLRPLVKECNYLTVTKSLNSLSNSQRISHIGGIPYFETGEHWPLNKKGQPLDFIIQIVNNNRLHIPPRIKILQFYYNWEEGPWFDHEDGWLIKTYEHINADEIQEIDKPQSLPTSEFCEILFDPGLSLPDWEGLDLICRQASDLSCAIEEDEPWDKYLETMSEMIGGDEEYRSQLGGYPTWIQGESTPVDENGVPLQLLLQLDSEDDAGLVWGDSGMIYIFYDSKTGSCKFRLQCY